MERLSAIDSVWLELEQSGPPVAVGGVTEIAGTPPTIAELRKFMTDRVAQMPRFRQKVVASRSKVLQPKWVDVEPDMAHHVQAMHIKPGRKNLDAAVSKIMEIPVNREHPLWDYHLVTGYSKSQFAVVTRLHHTIADGQGALMLLGRTIDLTAEGGGTLTDAIIAMTAPPEESDVSSKSAIQLAADHTVAQTEAAIAALGQFIRTAPDTLRGIASFAPQKPTELSGVVSTKRKWVSAHYSLGKVKIAGKAFKCTVNDIVLAGVTAGFQDLLQSRGLNIEGRTVRGVMPISLRPPGDTSSDNQVSLLPAPLPVGQADPTKRIKMIRNSTKHAKRSMVPILTDAIMRISAKVTPAPVQNFVVSKSGWTSEWFAETLITNVPGPQLQLYFMGREILGILPIIPVEGTTRIVIGITSYNGSLNIGITGDGEHAVDVDILLKGILKGLQELVDIAEQPQAS